MRKWLKVALFGTVFGTVFITVIAYFALFIMCGMIAFVTLDAAIFGEVLHRLTWHGFRLTVVVSFFISFIVFSFDN